MDVHEDANWEPPPMLEQSQNSPEETSESMYYLW